MIDKIFLTDAMAGVSKLQDKSIDLVLTDIPYNTCNNRLEGGLRKINKGDADSLSLLRNWLNF